MDDALIETSSAFSAHSHILGSDDVLHDSAPWFDITSSIRTVDADGSVDEADAGTNFSRAEDGSVETTIATRVSQTGKPDTQSFKVDDALIRSSSALSALSLIHI